MGSNLGLTYNIDITMCIDATASMSDLLDTVKANALNFYNDLAQGMQNEGKHISSLRVRMIVFRDYLADGSMAMLTTDFLNLPEQAEEFEALVKTIEAKGGGDDPEDGLEALAYAIKSDWTQEGNKKRHIIVVWSDEGTHELGFGKTAKNYPSKMPKDFDELTAWWGDTAQPGIMDNKAKRLIIFAPDSKYWSTISDCWNNVIHFQSESGQGLREVDYQRILELLRNTI